MIERPKTVWVILIWYVLSNALTFIVFTLIVYGYMPFKVVNNNISIINYALSIIVSLLEVSGAIMLFLLRSISVYLLLAGFVFSISMMIFQLINNTGSAYVGVTGFDIGLIAGHAISFAVCLYSFHLKYHKVIH